MFLITLVCSIFLAAERILAGQVMDRLRARLAELDENVDDRCREYANDQNERLQSELKKCSSVMLEQKAVIDDLRAGNQRMLGSYKSGQEKLRAIQEIMNGGKPTFQHQDGDARG